jgi:bloom syndrome protein
MCQLYCLLVYKNNVLKRVIIDEAHCVSNWGHEFRPSYLQLRQLKVMFPKIQVVSFTTTATPKVQLDMIKQLNMKNVVIHRQSFVRPNLSYQIKIKTGSSVVFEMSKLIKNKYNNQSGIIYCLSRQDCEDVSDKLKSLFRIVSDTIRYDIFY